MHDAHISFFGPTTALSFGCFQMGERKEPVNIDPTLRALGSVGYFVLMQQFVNTLAIFGAAYQLLGNIFIGRQSTILLLHWLR